MFQMALLAYEFFSIFRFIEKFFHKKVIAYTFGNKLLSILVVFLILIRTHLLVQALTSRPDTIFLNFIKEIDIELGNMLTLDNLNLFYSQETIGSRLFTADGHTVVARVLRLITTWWSLVFYIL